MNEKTGAPEATLEGGPMNDWLEERVHRLELSVGRLRKVMALGPESEPALEASTRLFLRKESWICLKRALALWWGLRWGRE